MTRVCSGRKKGGMVGGGGGGGGGGGCDRGRETERGRWGNGKRDRERVGRDGEREREGGRERYKNKEREGGIDR